MSKKIDEYTYMLRHVLNAVAMGKEYTWDAKYAFERAEKALEEVQGKIIWEDLMEMDIKDLYTLGFGNWDDRLLLIPLYLYPCIPDGTPLVSISGRTLIKGKDVIDLDVRFGCLAYGIIPPSLEEN